MGVKLLLHSAGGIWHPARNNGPAHQSWTPMTTLSDALGRLERFGPTSSQRHAMRAVHVPTSSSRMKAYFTSAPARSTPPLF